MLIIIDHITEVKTEETTPLAIGNAIIKTERGNRVLEVTDRSMANGNQMRKSNRRRSLNSKLIFTMIQLISLTANKKSKLPPTPLICIIAKVPSLRSICLC
jgi:hypothetical protein